MGSGICTRRQKGLLQTGFCLVALACLGSGVFLYNHLQDQVKATESLANKYKQQQETLSAQLQVVYEHRSRLERSLQKERGEHKKTKEDFLVYKLEAQEALNKEKQDSMNRYGALSSQHKILKNQHDEIKKQLIDLQLLHNSLKLEHRKVVEVHNQKYAQLQREKDSENAGLQDTIYKLREESKLLRKSHQDLHSQLVNAQVQIEEFRQLKETLQRMPSFKEMAVSKSQQRPPFKDQPLGPGSVPFQAARPKNSNEAKPGANVARNSLPVKQQGGDKEAHNEHLPNMLFGQLDPLKEAQLPPAAWPQVVQRDGAVVRFTRTVNSLQKAEQNPKAVQISQGGSEAKPPSETLDFRLPLPSRVVQALERRPTVGSKPDSPAQSWQDIVSKVGAQMGEEQAPLYPQNPLPDARPVPAMISRNQAPTKVNHQSPDGRGAVDDVELQMDAAMIEREEDNSLTQKEAMSDNVSDPAQDPNNQGEDELEEAELERPGFEEKVGQADELSRTNGPVEDTVKVKPAKVAGEPKKRADYPTDDYQEDEEQDLEDHQGGPEDTEPINGPRSHMGRDPKKDDYY